MPCKCSVFEAVDAKNVSSAKFLVILNRMSVRSLTYIRNKSEPRTEPCGTTEVINLN